MLEFDVIKKKQKTNRKVGKQEKTSQATRPIEADYCFQLQVQRKLPFTH